ncbi:hypothetical protein SFRURICE_013461 [Spodoptera frugiperda]|nr:hypothetical protein SFRURICE_013461 [Spodoptera frugiperda]
MINFISQLILARNINIWNYAYAIPNEETAVAASKAWLLIPAWTPRCPTCRGPMAREAKESYQLKYRLRCWRCASGVAGGKRCRGYEEDGNPKFRLTREMLGGTNDVVEIDETHLFSRKYHRGRLLRRQTWSFRYISRLTRKAHIELIPDKTRTTLDPIVEANVRTGRTLCPTCTAPTTTFTYGQPQPKLCRGYSSHSRRYLPGSTGSKWKGENPHQHPGATVAGTKKALLDRRLKWYMGEYMYRHNILKELPSATAQF